MHYRLTEIFSLDDAILDSTFRAFPCLFLVSVISRAIKEPISSFYGCVDGLML